MIRRARAQRVHSANAFSPWTVDDIWSVYTSKDKNTDQIAKDLARSSSAIDGIKVLIRYALQANSVDSVRNEILRRHYSKVTAEALCEFYRRVKLTNHKSEEKEVVETETEKTLHTSLVELEAAFDLLRNQVVEVISLAVEEKTADFKAQKEAEIIELKKEHKAEIAALQAVVDAAKKSNLATTIKNKLTGVW